MKIVRGGARDLDAVIGFGRAVYPVYFAQHWTAEGMHAFLDMTFDPDAMAAEFRIGKAAYFLARDSDRLLGFAKVVENAKAPLASVGEGLLLDKLYLLPDQRGRGLGDQLLQVVFDHALGCGETLVWLDVLKTNTGSRRFYERSGFVTAGDTPFATDTGEIGFWVMTRTLPHTPP